MSLKALIFDVDGTLAHTEESHLIAFNKAFKSLDLNWRWSKKLYKKLLQISGGSERIQYYITNYESNFKCDDINLFITKAHKLKTEYFQKIIKKGNIQLRTGIERLLLEAKNNALTLAIATTTTFCNVKYLFAGVNTCSLDDFKIVATSDIIKNKKPAADIYKYILTKLNIKASECLAFEDSKNGFLAANSANIKSIITTNNWTEKQSFKGALIVTDSLGEKTKSFNVRNSIIKDLGNNYVDVAMLKKLLIYSQQTSAILK